MKTIIMDSLVRFMFVRLIMLYLIWGVSEKPLVPRNVNILLCTVIHGYSDCSQETEMGQNLAFGLKNSVQYENPWHTYWENARLSCSTELQIILVHVILF